MYRHPTFIETLVQDVSRENKLRLLMVYAGVHPEKFEGEKGSKLMQVIVYPCGKHYWLLMVQNF